MNEPRIDLGEFANFFRGQAFVDSGEQPMNTVGPRRSQLFAQAESPAFPQARARGRVVRESEFPFAGPL